MFKENASKTQTILCRTYPAVFCHFCRTNLALSDISSVFWSFLSDTSSCGHIWLCRTYLAGTGPVPARYVRQSQICPQLDMSDKNDQKTHDMSDKARCVRQKFKKITRYVRQIMSDKNENRMQDVSDRTQLLLPSV